MKRFHVHLHVQDLAASIAFYAKLFAAEPSRTEVDYAKWMLDDPRINFAISTRGAQPGIDHLGFQTDSADELVELQSRAEAADLALHAQGTGSCCYAVSQKHWITDPQGVPWEHFHTLANIPVFGEGLASPATVDAAKACCTPSAPVAEVPANADAAAGCCTPSAPAAEAAVKARGKPVGIAVKSASNCC